MGWKTKDGVGKQRMEWKTRDGLENKGWGGKHLEEKCEASKVVVMGFHHSACAALLLLAQHLVVGEGQSAGNARSPSFSHHCVNGVGAGAAADLGGVGTASHRAGCRGAIRNGGTQVLAVVALTSKLQQKHC